MVAATEFVYSRSSSELAAMPSRGSIRRRAIPEDRVRRFCATSSPSSKAKYDKEPDAFNAYAYDTMILMAQVMRGRHRCKRSTTDCQGEGRPESDLRQGDVRSNDTDVLPGA